MPRTSFADIATDWERLLVTVANNKDDLQILEPYRAQLEIELAGARAQHPTGGRSVGGPAGHP